MPQNQIEDVEPDRAVSAEVESGAWKRIVGDWRQIFGNFEAGSVSLEWHDFSVPVELDWSRSFHPQSLEVCLNFSGDAMFMLGTHGRAMRAEHVALYTTTSERIAAIRSPGQQHRFFSLEVGVDYLQREFQAVMDAVRPELRSFCETGGKAAPDLRIEPMPTPLLGLRHLLLEPPVTPSAYPIWYHSKIMEILAHFLFCSETPGELFCEKHRRINRERCERVLFLLNRDMENPPSLQMLADEVGCSSFYLSRLFAQEIGVSIPKALRRMRIEKAAELLLAGGASVTGAAMEVGYSSLGAFNKAFSDQLGCTPGQFSKRCIENETLSQ